MTLTGYLMNFIGRPYIWGGNGTGKTHMGFDCSGLVLEGLWALGMYSGGDTTAQGLHDSLVKDYGWKEGSPEQAGDGDILFFGKSASKITHVAVALGGGLMLEAGGGGSACKTEATSTGSVRIRPIRKDVVSCTFKKE